MKIYIRYITTTICIIILICCIPSLSFAQSDTSKSEYHKSFNDFNKNIVTEFNSFKSKNDSIFYHFLEESWRSFELLEDTRPDIPKPIIQPVSDTTSIRNIEIRPLKRPTIIEDSGKQLILNGKPANFQIKREIGIPDIPTTTVNFYGLSLEIPEQTKIESDYSTVSNKDIALYFKNASNNIYLLTTIELLKEKALENQLNGWGYIELLKTASLKLYKGVNNQVLFTWFALLKTGYDARVGYNDKNILLLAPFDTPIFFNSYFEANNKKYFYVPYKGQPGNLDAVKSYETTYPGQLEILSLRFSNNPLLTSKVSTRKVQYHDKTINLSYNGNLIDYYKTYPECDISVYFPPPLSKLAISSLNSFIKPQLKNKTDVEKVNFLLDFIQYAIDYQTDEEQFGSENYLFAEETICYSYADCEDRSVLLAQLIKEYLGLNTIAIIYPGHVSLGVNIKAQIEGAHFEYNNNKYYTADPTYIGSRLGMIMPEFENVKPEIVEF